MSRLYFMLLLLVSCFTLLAHTSNALIISKQSLSSSSTKTRNRKRATVCNGSSDLCNRSYGNITFPGAHDSYAIGDSLATNQNVSVTIQLESGIRMLQSQAHKSINTTVTGSGIELCHTTCSLLDGGSLESWLNEIKLWTDSNPSEVVSLLIVNSDGLPASQFASAFESTGLSSKVYSPPLATIAKTKWPTLGTLIDASTTVVAFLTLQADHTTVPYLLDEFSNIWENPYDQVAYPFNCSIDRIGQDVTNASSLMYLSNQFLDSSYLDGAILTPNKEALPTTNSIQGTLSTSNTCASEHSSYPNFILTDFSTIPNFDLMRAVAQMNRVSYIAPYITSTSSSSPSSSSSSSSTSSVSSLKSLLHSRLAYNLASIALFSLLL